MGSSSDQCPSVEIDCHDWYDKQSTHRQHATSTKESVKNMTDYKTKSTRTQVHSTSSRLCPHIESLT